MLLRESYSHAARLCVLCPRLKIAEMMGDAAQGDEATLAPLTGLVDRLRGKVTELQGRWEALGEELEAKRRRLRLAEATMELLQRRGDEAEQEEEKGAEGGGASRAEEERHYETHTGKASVVVPHEPLRGHVRSVTDIMFFHRLLLALQPAASVRAHRHRATVG
jgi:hypothetical protein